MNLKMLLIYLETILLVDGPGIAGSEVIEQLSKDTSKRA
jgi:hypothetical protein